MKPLARFYEHHDLAPLSAGKELLEKGKVGAIILAGGQASRLGIHAPKGTVEVTPIKKKSLFQLFSEKCKACSKMAGRSLPIAFMTSRENDASTRAFFQEHNFFDIQPAFFQQGDLPLIDEATHSPLQQKAPNGNGSLFWNCQELLAKWEHEGIEYVTLSLIDNPLINPWNLDLLSLAPKSDVTIVAVERTSPDEKVGLIVQDEAQKLRVVEYSEMPAFEKLARESSGKLTYRLANISTFCFSMSFMKKMGKLPIESMPQHTQRKFSAALQQWVIKSEYYIFDAIEYADSVEVLLLDRKECFAPLKNKEGPDSLQTVQAALLEQDRRLYGKVSGVEVKEERIFELSVEFQYPTKELEDEFRGKPLPAEAYIG